MGFYSMNQFNIPGYIHGNVWIRLKIIHVVVLDSRRVTKKKLDLYNIEELQPRKTWELNIKHGSSLLFIVFSGMSSIVSVLLCQCQAIHSTKKWDLWDLTKHKNLCLECFPKSSIPPPITSLEYPWFTCSGILRSWRLFASRCQGGRDLSGKSNDSMVTLATAQCQEWKWAKNIGFLHFHAVDIQNHEVNSPNS
jgi:hypothetical protein